MRLLASSLTEYSQRWFRGLLDNHVESYEYFTKLFNNRWTKNKENGMFVAKLNQINKKQNETVSEIENRIDRLYNQIPMNLCSTDVVVHLL
jgi:DNA-binding transcriptional regulator GbsR (MarR family)